MKIENSNNTVSNQPKFFTQNKSQNNQKEEQKDSSKIFAGNLNIGSDIENKKKRATTMAMNLLKNAFANDNNIDNEIQSRHDNIDNLKTEISDNSTMLDNIEKEKEIIKEGYGLSDEEAKNNSEIIALDEVAETYKEKINDSQKEIVSENSIIRGIHIERLKSHEMVDANKQSDQILEASSKEIIGMIVEDVKDNIDKTNEENKEKAEEKQEEKEKIEEKIKAAKEEKENDDQKEMYELDYILSDITNKSQSSTQPDVKKSVELIVNELKLTSEDLKGVVVDKNL